jgi:hypothetical protein
VFLLFATQYVVSSVVEAPEDMHELGWIEIEHLKASKVVEKVGALYGNGRVITGCPRINSIKWNDGGLISKNTELLLLNGLSILSEIFVFEVNGVTAFTTDVDEEEWSKPGRNWKIQ